MAMAAPVDLPGVLNALYLGFDRTALREHTALREAAKDTLGQLAEALKVRPGAQATCACMGRVPSACACVCEARGVVARGRAHGETRRPSKR